MRKIKIKALSKQLMKHAIEIARKVEEIRQLRKAGKEGFKKIREFIQSLGEVLTKACLFDRYMETEERLSASKVITFLVDFQCKMDTTLAKMQKIKIETVEGIAIAFKGDATEEHECDRGNEPG